MKTNSPLFHDLDADALSDIAWRMSRRCFAPGEYLCREGDQDDSLFLIERGVVEVVVKRGGEAVVIDRLRAGDIVGEMALLTGEPRAASVVAGSSVETLVLDRAAFVDLIARYPALLVNISRLLVERRKRATISHLDRHTRGEVVALVAGADTAPFVETIIGAAQATTPQPLRIVDLMGSLSIRSVPLPDRSAESAVTLADAHVVERALVVMVVDTEHEELVPLLRFADRALFIGNPDEHRRAQGLAPPDRAADFGLLVDGPAGDILQVGGDDRRFPCLDRCGRSAATAWMGRHLARTKIGLALGAGGAKGYAHVGVLDDLESSGYAIDYIGGSSIGAVVSILKASGMGAGAIEGALNRIWSDDAVSRLAVLGDDGVSLGLQEVLAAVGEIVGDRRIDELDVPTTVMSADLEHKAAAPLTDWPIVEALRAALAIPGLAPPYPHDGRRLVDGICLVPVPAAALRAAGADIVISVNLLGREAQRTWPGPVPPPPEHRRKPARALDPVVETLMMLQTDASIRNAETGDVVMTPRFGPSSWRDFHYAKLFRAAGRRAAEERRPRLYELAWPAG